MGKLTWGLVAAAAAVYAVALYGTRKEQQNAERQPAVDPGMVARSPFRGDDGMVARSPFRGDDGMVARSPFRGDDGPGT